MTVRSAVPLSAGRAAPSSIHPGKNAVRGKRRPARKPTAAAAWSADEAPRQSPMTIHVSKRSLAILGLLLILVGVAIGGYILGRDSRSADARKLKVLQAQTASEHSDLLVSQRRELWGRAFGAFPDAWVLLGQEYGILRRIHDASHSRSAPVILLTLLMAAATLLTNGFIRGRNLLLHDDSAGLVLIAQPIPFMGGRSRMPAAQAEAQQPSHIDFRSTSRGPSTSGDSLRQAPSQSSKEPLGLLREESVVQASSEEPSRTARVSVRVIASLLLCRSA